MKNTYKVPEKVVKKHHYICRGVYLLIIKKMKEWNNLNKKRVIINLEPDLYEKLKDTAKQNYCTMTQVLKVYRIE